MSGVLNWHRSCRRYESWSCGLPVAGSRLRPSQRARHAGGSLAEVLGAAALPARRIKPLKAIFRSLTRTTERYTDMKRSWV